MWCGGEVAGVSCQTADVTLHSKLRDGFIVVRQDNRTDHTDHGNHFVRGEAPRPVCGSLDSNLRVKLSIG